VAVGVGLARQGVPEPDGQGAGALEQAAHLLRIVVSPPLGRCAPIVVDRSLGHRVAGDAQQEDEERCRDTRRHGAKPAIGSRVHVPIIRCPRSIEER
jgi:hypothetical protein